MATIVVGFTNQGVPATGLSPTIRIRRTDTQALVVTDAAMTEQGDGAYSYDFAPTDGIEYSIRADGTATLPNAERYAYGSLSGTTEARVEVDVPAILADTDSLDTTKITAGRAANLDEITAARLAELDAANMPADLDAVLADTAAMQPTIATNLDAAVSSRAAPGDAMDLVANAVDAAAIATDAIDADAIAAGAITATEAPALANLDAAVSSRSSHSAADVDTVLSASHGAGAWDGVATPQQIRDAMKLAPTAGPPAAGSVDEHLDDILADTAAIQPTVATNLDAAVSSRSSHTPADVDTTLSAAHGSGAWDGTAAPQVIRDAMKLAPTPGAPAAGSIDEHLDDVLADAAELNDTKITTARANNLDEITAARLAELDAANVPADVDTLVARTVDLDAAVAFLGAVLGTPVTHTPTTVTAGGYTWSISIVGSTITVTRLT